MTEEKLLNDLKQLKINSSKPIPEFPNTYILNSNGLLGVAVETVYKSEITEKFNSVTLIKVKIKREEAYRDVIFLYIEKNQINNFFIRLCYSFLKDCELVAKNPIEWCEGWKDVLGNTKTEKRVYDVLAELKVLNYLQKKEDNPNLDSATKGTFDVSSDSGFYEVKASTLKTQEIVTIHNQFQLDTKSLDRPLYITYCKVEQNNAGDSINSICSELIGNGYNMVQISNYLESLGYYEGNIERDKKYLFHEIRLYEVNDDFPRIEDKSFVNGKIPANIVKIEYNVSLDGLGYIKIQ